MPNLTVGKSNHKNVNRTIIFAIGEPDNTWYEIEIKALGYSSVSDAIDEATNLLEEKLLVHNISFFVYLGIFDDETYGPSAA